ncbi:MAG: Glu/Leu/Phe/Val dehydrogenase dimerization domain-containing protein [Chitinophagales bacterium]|nr:Glu/Leu/Phe/Val dehydrogenase dimerization domain-containing protein [Chitinophagales bacterium]
MDKLLDAFRNKRPEVVFEWKDPFTEAEGWVVINSLRGGAAGGGTRMRKGLDRAEVESLSKTMEIKFTVSGPNIGGAKSGINFDPSDPRKEEVLNRWFQAVTPLLKNYYGTGGDLNIDEIKEVIPLTEDYGLWHPQEGVVNGHFHPSDKDKIHIIGQLRQGVSKKLEDPRFSPDVSQKFVVADMITGYGVAEAVRHFYTLFKGADIKGKRAIIQGWGNVAAAAAYYLAFNGVKVVGIIDREGGIIHEKGLGFEEVRHLFLNRRNNKLIAPDLIPFDTINQQIWNLPADIFIPGAASRLVTAQQVDSLAAQGLSVISCGANVPFQESDLFFGTTTAHVDSQVSVIPDFIANCGMARVFAYLMQRSEVEVTDEAIFNDISHTIYKALKEIHETEHSGLNMVRSALNIALEKLVGSAVLN